MNFFEIAHNAIYKNIYEHSLKPVVTIKDQQKAIEKLFSNSIIKSRNALKIWEDYNKNMKDLDSLIKK